MIVWPHNPDGKPKQWLAMTPVEIDDLVRSAAPRPQPLPLGHNAQIAALRAFAGAAIAISAATVTGIVSVGSIIAFVQGLPL